MSKPRDQETASDGYPERPTCGNCGHSSDWHPMVELDGETGTRCTGDPGDDGPPCAKRCRRFVYVVPRKIRFTP
jgi:hypothetical protein